MSTSRVGTGLSKRAPRENFATLGLLISNSADRRLLTDFLQQSSYRVRMGTPSEGLFENWAEISMIIADEHAAQQYRQDFLALKHQLGGFFLPLLIALPQKSESTPWLFAGFDDVLRLPLRKQELAARLQVYLRLRAQSEESRRLATQVVLAQEAERRRLSRELHDEIGQALTAVSFNLQAYQQAVNNPAIEAHLRDSLSIIENTLRQVRDLALDLHPTILDDLGLVAALEWHISRQSERASMHIELVADPLEQSLPADLKTTCFRIVQEALTNVLRHSRAKHVWVELRLHKRQLELVIRDDGIGFDVSAVRGASLGLLGMQERVALMRERLHIKSAHGAGTEIRARFPLSTVSATRAQGKRRKGQADVK